VDLVQSIAENVQARRLIGPRARVVVAVSGGVDSMVLLHALHALARPRKWSLHVAHFNHLLRGRQSDADARFVIRTARHLGIPCEGDSADVKRFAREAGLSIEAAGRQLRHAFLVRVARSHQAKTIVLAHHADDQVELFFLRLLRGAGTAGLAGMDWRSPSPFLSSISLVRPLLDQPKEALLEFARRKKIQFREDASNACREMTRNRVRHDLIPLLTRSYQPALAKIVWRQMEILRAESEHLSTEVKAWLEEPDHLPFSRLATALQRRCLQTQLQAHGVTPSFDLVEQLRREPRRRVMVAPHLSVVRNEQGWVNTLQVESARFQEALSVLPLTDRVGRTTFGGLPLSWRIVSQRSPALPARQTGTEWYDADKVGTRTHLRYWRPGDRFQPIGLAKPVKLQDLFTNAKISADQRRHRVLATTGSGEIWWVQGLRISERFKITAATKRRLRWSWG
jgi:tRNA(Ile)-lysidine synthase